MLGQGWNKDLNPAMSKDPKPCPRIRNIWDLKRLDWKEPFEKKLRFKTYAAKPKVKAVYDRKEDYTRQIVRLCKNSHCEALVGSEKADNENRGEVSCEEGDIMVEIVGSDVFVDGVKGDFGAAEIGEENVLEEEKSETTERSEAIDVSSEGGENKAGESELDLPDSKDESNHVFVGAIDDSVVKSDALDSDDRRLSKNVEGIAYEEPQQPLDCQENDDPEHRHLPETKEPEETPIVISDASYHPITEHVGEIDEKVESEPMKIVGNEVSSLEAKTTLDSLSHGYDKRVGIYAAKVSTNTSNNKPSFKIGDCIPGVASQLTGSKEETVIDDSLKNTEKRSMVLSIESFSVNEMLSQLEQVSQEPMRRNNLSIIHTFFMGFRSSIALNRRGRKRMPEQTDGRAKGFEFDDVSDSYWTDRIVQNYSELNGLVVPAVTEKPAKPNRRPNSRKRFSDKIFGSELDERVKRRKQESSPAELILNFAERNRIPSEISLNKMFRRFWPLMESETEVDHESGCAKVIFKRGLDAEVARNSSEVFKIFEPVLVGYHIGYESVVSVRVLPLAMPQIQEDMVLMQ